MSGNFSNSTCTLFPQLYNIGCKWILLDLVRKELNWLQCWVKLPSHVLLHEILINYITCDQHDNV